MLFRMMYDCMPVGLGGRGAFERPTATASLEQGAAVGERLLWLCLPPVVGWHRRILGLAYVQKTTILRKEVFSLQDV